MRNHVQSWIPNVYIGPATELGGYLDAAEQIGRAVVEAGGSVCPTPTAANSIVWFGAPPDQIPRHLHDGIKWVQVTSAGVDEMIDKGVVDRRRVFTGCHESYADGVAEMALILMLAGSRGLGEYARRQTWDREVSRDGPLLRPGTTVAIIGAGGIGSRLIELLRPFGVHTIAVTRSGRSVAGADESLSADAIPGVWGRAQYYVLAAPSTPETRHMVGKEQLAAMGRNSWVINIARGSLIDTDALVTALHDHMIAGACLDVTDPEPLPDGHPLWTAPGLILTPHVANPAAEQLNGFVSRIADNVRRIIEGRPLAGLVDLDRGY
jgi:D-3-phosphoglycerate dehydrogenase